MEYNQELVSLSQAMGFLHAYLSTAKERKCMKSNNEEK